MLLLVCVCVCGSRGGGANWQLTDTGAKKKRSFLAPLIVIIVWRLNTSESPYLGPSPNSYISFILDLEITVIDLFSLYSIKSAWKTKTWWNMPAFFLRLLKLVCWTCSMRNLHINSYIFLTEGDVLDSPVTVTRQPADTVGSYCSQTDDFPIKLTSIDYTSKTHPSRVN